VQAPATVNLSATTTNATGESSKWSSTGHDTGRDGDGAQLGHAELRNLYGDRYRGRAGTYSYTAKAYDSVATTTTTAAVVSVSQGAGS